ncbi:MAG TPA: NUDIX hydrolase [Candidatus Saccharimonadales bacterium]|jgi:8-oxo-dGTP pyrophosphatase MutT (NUDIX family)|nr:NUDIX hydrolase [Candidatus Saccharimonadales bacterium]
MADTELVSQVAAKAVIVGIDGKILMLREAATYKDGTHTGKYHMPGGRLEKGESFLDGLAREVREETGLRVEPQFPLHVDEWRPVIKGVPHHIIAVFMLCKLQGSADAVVSDEHDEAVWVTPAETAAYELLPEDRLAVDAYINRVLPQ